MSTSRKSEVDSDSESNKANTTIGELQQRVSTQAEIIKGLQKETAILHAYNSKNQEEIEAIFSAIRKSLSLKPALEVTEGSYSNLSHNCEQILGDLRLSLNSFETQLKTETNGRIDNIPVETARNLKKAVDEVLNPDSSYFTKHAAVNSFRNSARGAMFSEATNAVIIGVVGGLIGLAVWIAITIATGGVAALITTSALGVAALITTFTAFNFSARSNDLIRNPNENRGRQVSADLKALIQYRKELSPIIKQMKEENNEELQSLIKKNI